MTLFALIKGNTTFKDIYSWMTYNDNNDILKQIFEKEEIHIYGRITVLADVFDALGSARVYKEARDDERIFKLFKEERGEHFDQKFIDIFFEHLDEFLAIRDNMKDVKED